MKAYVVELQERVSVLEDRLELYGTDGEGKRVKLPDSCDGIACRDETIKGLETRLAEAERLLRPFAALSQPHQERATDDQPLFGINSALIRHGDVRAAAAFLRPADSAPAVCPRCNGHGVVPDLRGDQPCPACSASPMQCPCGALYLKVEGGYVPTCTCSADNTVTVDVATDQQPAATVAGGQEGK